MYSQVRTLGINGINGYAVTVECFITNGLPGFEIVGLPDASIKEAKERVRAAIKTAGLKFPVSRITVNLAPADTKKTGTLYDLPILLAILSAANELKIPKENAAYLGELSLEGKLRKVNGVLPMAIAATGCGIDKIYVPQENAREATLADGLTVMPISDISALVKHFSAEQVIAPQPKWEQQTCVQSILDFSDIKGQKNARRAMEIAAAGAHNILMVGPPGSGKSMLAKRLPSILPDMSKQEALEVTQIHSIMGLLDNENPLVTVRPFRSPHHTVSPVGLAGGGTFPRPGEISLAHQGVLFLDELPEFKKESMEVMRQPLEDGKVTITRAVASETYPCEFMLVCAMNPCRCGWYGDSSGRCTCSAGSIDNYLSKISGPLLDRIDMIIEVPAVEFEALREQGEAENSATIRERINAARKVQLARFAGTPTANNAHMSAAQLQKLCVLTDDCAQLMKAAFEHMGLTARSYDRILKVARTIADLDGKEQIEAQHIAEAIQYRTFKIGRR